MSETILCPECGATVVLKAVRDKRAAARHYGMAYDGPVYVYTTHVRPFARHKNGRPYGNAARGNCGKSLAVVNRHLLGKIEKSAPPP